MKTKIHEIPSVSNDPNNPNGLNDLSDLNVSVIGAGGWGTTLGNLLATKGISVKIWSYEQETVDHINNLHKNPQYLPNIALSPNLKAYSKLESVVPNSDVIVFAVPSAFVRSMAQKLLHYSFLIRNIN